MVLYTLFSLQTFFWAYLLAAFPLSVIFHTIVVKVNIHIVQHRNAKKNRYYYITEPETSIYMDKAIFWLQSYFEVLLRHF